MNNVHKWSLLLREYPLSIGKSNLIRRSSDPIRMGILTDHLMGVARKLKLPNVYISALNTLRSNSKHDKEYWKTRLIHATNLLLTATNERIIEITLATQK
jgi:hypothetical protein